MPVVCDFSVSDERLGGLWAVGGFVLLHLVDQRVGQEAKDAPRRPLRGRCVEGEHAEGVIAHGPEILACGNDLHSSLEVPVAVAAEDGRVDVLDLVQARLGDRRDRHGQRWRGQHRA